MKSIFLFSLLYAAPIVPAPQFFDDLAQKAIRPSWGKVLGVGSLIAVGGVAIGGTAKIIHEKKKAAKAQADAAGLA